MDERNKRIVARIITYANKIRQYCEGITEASFIGDNKLVDACVMNLVQIGELANQFDEAFTDTHSEVPWRQIRGLRNHIVHDYEGLNLTQIWAVISEDLSVLIEHMEKLL